MPSLRELTKQQFRDGTTVDGNRIDGALDSLVAAFNTIHPKHREGRWVQQQIVGGYQGQDVSVAGQPSTPWMQAFNGATSTFTPQNQFRSKGIDVEGIFPVTGALGTGMLYEWEASFGVTKPLVLQALQLWLHTDANNFDNSFTAGANAPPGLANTNPLRDLSVTVLVDHPFDLENRRSTSAVLQKTRFSLDTVNANPFAIVPGAVMAPAMPSASVEACNGVCVTMRNIAAPIPRDSRVRFIFTIPAYNTASFDTTWDVTPWLRQYYSWTATVLEPLEAL